MGQSIAQRMNETWDAYLVSPADFAGPDDIIINLAKEKEPDPYPFSDVRPKWFSKIYTHLQTRTAQTPYSGTYLCSL